MLNHEKDHIGDMTREILVKRKTSFNWSFLLVFTGPLIGSLILFSIFATGEMHPASWVNWTIFLIFVPLILISLVLGQKRQLVGAYGETILLLIPTFVWLLPGNDETIKLMTMLSFSIVLIGVVIYACAGLPKYFKYKKEDSAHKITQILLRVGFVASTVTSTVIISIILINFADHSLSLAPVIDAATGEKDYTDTTWIAFISIVTIIVALILVILGLATGMKASHARTFNKDQFAMYKHKHERNLVKTSKFKFWKRNKKHVVIKDNIHHK